MIQEFVDKFIAAKEATLIRFADEAVRPGSYDELFEAVVEILTEDNHETPDPERITVIDHGHYQGTRVFVVGACGYQPSIYWACSVAYGSCSHCDSFERARDNDNSVEQFWVMALHMVQQLVEI